MVKPLEVSMPSHAGSQRDGKRRKAVQTTGRNSDRSASKERAADTRRQWGDEGGKSKGVSGGVMVAKDGGSWKQESEKHWSMQQKPPGSSRSAADRPKPNKKRTDATRGQTTKGKKPQAKKNKWETAQGLKSPIMMQKILRRMNAASGSRKKQEREGAEYTRQMKVAAILLKRFRACRRHKRISVRKENGG